MKKPLIFLSALAALVLLMAACGSDPTPAPAINQVTFTASDYAYGGLQFMPAVMTEIGGELHHQKLMTIPEGMSSDDLIAGMVSGEAGPSPPGVTSAGGVGPIGPGGTGRATLNMTAGNYLAICFIPNAEGVPHMALGMNKPITVIESSAPVAPLPSAKVLVDMVDFELGLS